MTTNDELTTVMEFVAQDTSEFDLVEFMNHWPKKAADQRVALGMIVARSSREVKRLSHSHSRLWAVAITAVGVGSVSLLLHLKLSPVESLGGALVGVAASLLLKALSR